MKRSAVLLPLALLLLLAAANEGGAPQGFEWFASGHRAVEQAKKLSPGQRRARNVVIFLGDGMGITTVTAARILEGQLRGESGEENSLSFEQLPYVSLVKTYNTNQQTPDSAGTMTAILSGAKTRAGVVGVDESVARGDAAGVEGHRLVSLFEQAEKRGLATGIVTTTTVTHATPAAAYAHTPERGWENDSSLSDSARKIDFPDVARQLVEFAHGDGLEVVLGGGRVHFLPREATDPEYPEQKGRRADGRDLLAEWMQRYPEGRYVWRGEDFSAIEPAKTTRLLGLFEPSHMRFEIERKEDPGGEPSLAEMTRKAIQLLSRKPAGYLLLVEGGRIDHGHHLGNAYRALRETIAFSDAVRAALDETSPRDTLVVVTADHGHVFTIGGYATRGNPILGKVVQNDGRGEPRKEPALDALGLPFTALGYWNGPGYTGKSHQQPEGAKAASPAVSGQRPVTAGRPDLGDVDTEAPDYLQEAAVPLPSETHSAEDVPVYAGGPGAHLLHGVHEQSYLYHAIVEALGWKPEN